MNRKEFQSLLTPLNEKELRYKENPALSLKAYKDSSAAPEADEHIKIFDYTDVVSSQHGFLFPGQQRHDDSGNLFFSKQTRFSNVPLHKHTFLEMNYVYSGSCTACINGIETHLEQGDACIMDVGVVHTIYPTGTEDIVINCLMKRSYFDMRFIDRLARSGPVSKFLAYVLNDSAKHDQYLMFHTNDSLLLRELFENTLCEYLDPAVCSSDVTDSYMTLIFIELARCYQNFKEQEYRNQSHSYLTEVLRYVENHCNDCTLKSTAEQFHFHPNYLSRAIHQATGQTFKELVVEARLKQADFLLKNTSQPIAEIAAQCGWSNISQFYKKFFSIYGCTPNDHRKRD